MKPFFAESEYPVWEPDNYKLSRPVPLNINLSTRALQIRNLRS